MYWNIGIHIIVGLFSANIFTLTFNGIMTCISFTCIIQGIDLIRIYRTKIGEINQQPPHIQEEQMKTFRKLMPMTFSRIYIKKIFGYGFLSLVTANIVRVLQQT